MKKTLLVLAIVVVAVFGVAINVYAATTCGTTGMLGGSTIQGLRFYQGSNTVDDNASNTLVFYVQNTTAETQTVSIEKWDCRCGEHLGFPYRTGIGQCQYYWTPNLTPTQLACQIVNEDVVIAPGETKTIQLSVTQFQNQLCGSFQLDIALTKINGIPYGTDWSNQGIGSSFTDMCQDCTYTPSPTLTVTKVVINDNGGTKVISDFPLFIDGMSVTSGVASTTSAGAHLVSETADSGYTSIISGNCAADGTITLLPGEVKTCTITNNDKVPSLTLLKTVTNDNGGDALNTAWTLTATGASSTPTNLTGTALVASGLNFIADTYTLAESGGPSGYTASSWSCVGAPVTSASVTIGLGDTVTCTITNNDIAPVAQGGGGGGGVGGGSIPLCILTNTCGSTNSIFASAPADVASPLAVASSTNQVLGEKITKPGTSQVLVAKITAKPAEKILAKTGFNLSEFLALLAVLWLLLNLLFIVKTKYLKTTLKI